MTQKKKGEVRKTSGMGGGIDLTRLIEKTVKPAEKLESAASVQTTAQQTAQKQPEQTAIDVMETIGVTKKLVTSLKEKRFNPEKVKEYYSHLQEKTEEDAEAIGKLNQVKAFLERRKTMMISGPEDEKRYWLPSMEKQHLDEVINLINELRKLNTMAAKLADEKAKYINEQRREVWRIQHEAEVTAIKRGKEGEQRISLHEGCEEKEGFIPLKVRYTDRVTGRDLEAWIKIQVLEGNARIVEAERIARWMVNYGTDRNGQPNWVRLDPDTNFGFRDGESGWPRAISGILPPALTSLYEWEETRKMEKEEAKKVLQEEKDKTTITVCQLLEGEKGYVGGLSKGDWQNMKSGKVGYLAVSVEGTGDRKVVVRFVQTQLHQHFVQMLDKEQSLADLDRQLKAFLNWHANGEESKTPA